MSRITERLRPATQVSRAVLLLFALLVGVLVAPGRAEAVSCPGGTTDQSPIVVEPEAASSTTTTPVLSVLLETYNGVGSISGSLFVTDSAGNAVAGTPMATGSVLSGQRLTYQVPAGALSVGTTYKWWVTASISACVHSSSSPISFTPTTSTSSPGTTTGPDAVTITGSSLTAETAKSDPTACSGSPCPLSQNPATLDVGGDGASHWVSALKPDLSAIPTGSTIDSATLNLKSTACLNGCAGDTLNIGLAQDDVTTRTDGKSLAAVSTTLTASGAEAAGTYDITTLVAEWADGDVADDGILLSASDETTATSGVGYAGPTAASGAASIKVTYTPPAVPSAPTSLTTTAGDGGVLVAWAEPASTGYVEGEHATDNDDPGDGISSYTVSAVNAAGSTVATTTTSTTTEALLTGLTDGTSYTVKVTATNPVGTGPAASATGVSPEAVPGGPTQYVQAVSQMLNARDGLEKGTYSTSTAALASDSYSTYVSTWLGYESAADVGVHTAESANSESETSDTTTLSNSLAALSADGSMVTVYTTADETFTTVDTKNGTTDTTPGEAIDQDAYSFSVTGTVPQISQAADADALVKPVTAASEITAYSASLDGTPAGTPSALATDSSTGYFTAGTETVSASGGHWANLSGVVAWANKWYDGTYNGFSDDCTDFASRALHYGGKLNENTPSVPPAHHSDDHYWFQSHGLFGATTSYSWAGAYHQANFQNIEGSYFYSYALDASPGDLIFANWSGGSFSGISHTGVVVKNHGGNLYIDQHSNTRHNEPLLKEGSQKTWASGHPNLHVWIVSPHTKF
ncbi:DNRLRE domain-containing protein [Streptomyces arenae]|uniref:DNRLRE domain-containing protein n=1 Tax=Streptomyces arenae TaxID=29301 RepID=UPI002657B892|nr:DNRLRE domain-containing protein [Streptomyces arenae]MCG7209449.1 DNRLRE domain-containing protein [Streptomyces arenae]